MVGRPSLVRRAPWVAMAVVLVLALAIGARTGGGGSAEDRVRAVASTIKCPQCAGQSAATSDAPTAAAIRADIADRLGKGQSPDRIRDYYASRYGEAILLTPGRSGVAGLVWALPVAVVVVAFAGPGLAFRRWQRSTPTALTPEDRALVSAARRTRPPPGEDEPFDPHGEGDGR